MKIVPVPTTKIVLGPTSKHKSRNLAAPHRRCSPGARPTPDRVRPASARKSKISYYLRGRPAEANDRKRKTGQRQKYYILHYLRERLAAANARKSKGGQRPKNGI